MQETITVNDTIIPTHINLIYKVPLYNLACYYKILKFESAYISLRHAMRAQLFNGNCVFSQYESNVKSTLNIYKSYFTNNDLDMLIRINETYDIENPCYFEEIKTLKSSNKKCICPYKYRTIRIGFILTEHQIQRYDVCNICKNTFTRRKLINMEYKKYGVYLASEIPNQNILSVLPNDIAKNIINYIA
jgi:hypothetical protein